MGFNSAFKGLNKSFTSVFKKPHVIKQSDVAGKCVPAVKECVRVKVEFHAFLT